MTYAGNRLFNANNLVGLFFILVGVFFASQTKDSPGLFMLIIIFAAFLITSGQAFYFEITDDELIVKNYIIFFLNIHYKLNEITQIQLLETSSKSSATARVRIIRGDKKSFPFPPSSLRMNDWQQFVNHLCEKQIHVEIGAIKLKSMIGTPED